MRHCACNDRWYTLHLDFSTNNSLGPQERWPSNSGSPALDAEVAYDLVADVYDEWKWQEVWRAAEWPRVVGELQRIERRLRKINRLVDIGTGTGSYLASIPGDIRVMHKYGTDISRGMLARAEAKLGRSAILSRSDVRKLAYPDGFFDVALLLRVASHIPNLGEVVSEVARVLSPGGIVLVTDIHSCHTYERTAIPFQGEKIGIETYKHSIREWERASLDSGLQFLHQEVVYPADLVFSGIKELPRSIDLICNRPILFILSLQKKLRNGVDTNDGHPKHLIN